LIFGNGNALLMISVEKQKKDATGAYLQAGCWVSAAGDRHHFREKGEESPSKEIKEQASP
jgi:hypothetical protein